MGVLRVHTGRGDTKGLNVDSSVDYDCIDCGKRLALDGKRRKAALHTWELPTGAVVSICVRCKTTRMESAAKRAIQSNRSVESGSKREVAPTPRRKALTQKRKGAKRSDGGAELTTLPRPA